MGRKRTYLPRKKRLRLIEQKVLLEREYPGTICELRRNKLVWRGVLCPSAFSREYKVQISYDEKTAPRIVVSGDSLRGLDRSNFPHKYDVDSSNKRVRVCLYLPLELDYGKPFADTLVPWTIEWLFHYEIWLATGTWCGGGEHPVVGKKRPFVKKKSSRC